jgi:hypothetical protein
LVIDTAKNIMTIYFLGKYPISFPISTSPSTASRLKAARRDGRVEPVGKPPERHFLALSGGDVFSLMPIRIVLSMILGPDDKLYLT